MAITTNMKIATAQKVQCRPRTVPWDNWGTPRGEGRRLPAREGRVGRWARSRSRRRFSEIAGSKRLGSSAAGSSLSSDAGAAWPSRGSLAPQLMQSQAPLVFS